MATSAFSSALVSRLTPPGVVRVLRRVRLPTDSWQLVALAAAYYFGALIGFAFQSPSVPQSVLWLPNAILLAALLMSPPRRWPVLLAAGFPSQLLVALGSGAPLTTLSLLYITNCLDAVLGASAVRLISRGRWQLVDLRSFLVFLGVGALAGPLLVSFLDAAITVMTGWSTHFWDAYRTRLLANSLTNVIVVPAIVGMVGVVQRRRRTAAYFLEASVLVAALLVVSILVFSRPIDAGAIGRMYLPLPFLLWAAVRFGPGITGLSLLAVAFVSSWSVLHGSGAFASADPAASIRALQSLLLCISIPVLFVTMVVQEREEVMLELIQSRNAIRVGVDTVRDLAGRLIANQEMERARIARELHDGIAQYVAEIGLQVSAARRSAAAKAAGLEGDFRRLADQTSLLFESIRSLSHELHPSVLRHAGLVPATRSLCESVSRQNNVAVHFDANAVDWAPDDVALCIYRVAQEALHNAATHARARNVSVTMTHGEEGLALTIDDDGTGFDVVAAHARRGLGLVSMEERVRLLRGRFRIESGASGTHIVAILPAERPA